MPEEKKPTRAERLREQKLSQPKNIKSRGQIERERVQAQQKARQEAAVQHAKEQEKRVDYGKFTPRVGSKRKLSEYDINAQNRKGAVIAHAEAEGSKGMHQARRKIWTSKHTWMKFAVYNRTRGKFVRG